jgi:hypothetical protein
MTVLPNKSLVIKHDLDFVITFLILLFLYIFNNFFSIKNIFYFYTKSKSLIFFLFLHFKTLPQGLFLKASSERFPSPPP